MPPAYFNALISCYLILVLGNVRIRAQNFHRKFEYKHSFRGPNLSQRDGTIPFWETLGDAIASSEQLRLAPSMRSKIGAAWNTRSQTESEFWEMEMSFKVTGQGRIGADGLAFWYTAAKGALGPVFGSNDYWTGLGVFFDSFDNDAQRNNPFIMMMINDGTRTYDHQTDGSQQMLTGCQKDFRNRPFPVKIKVEYLKNILTVFVHDGMTPNDRYELCMRAENIFLPRNGFFGLSAATGGLADDHDVLSFSIYSLSAQVPQQPAIMPKDEQKKYEEEFQRQAQEFEKEKEKFQKEHPDKAKASEDDYSKIYEDAMQREIRMIYEGQNSIHHVISQLDVKLNQIIQQQQQHTQLISTNQAGGGQQVASGGVAVDTFKRHEVNEVLQATREMNANIKDIRNFVVDIQSRTLTLDQRLSSGAAPLSNGGGTGGVDQLQFQTYKSYLEGIKHDVEQLRINNNRGQPCPVQETNCLSPMFFLFALFAQSVAFFVYSVMK